MRETLELRINYDYAHLLFRTDEGKDIGTSVKVVEISKDDLRYKQLPVIAKEVKKKYDAGFVFGWEIKRRYSKKELASAKLLHLKIKSVFEPTGEECGTIFDEMSACKICGADRKQISSLILKKGTIPLKDIAKTIGGEVIVSEKFVNAIKQRDLKGLQINPTNIEKYYQLTTIDEVDLSHQTIAGVAPWDFSESSNSAEFTIAEGYTVYFKEEIYKCPNGDTIGLNLLSEPYVLSSRLTGCCDFFKSRQHIGVTRGLLRPEPVYFCSQAFRKMVEEEKLTGFKFEIANVESE